MLLAAHVAAAALAAGCPADAPSPDVPPRTTQLITVRAARVKTTYASLRTWQRVDGCWQPVAGPYTARVGWNGLRASRREGDGTTPIGTFGIGARMYGNAPKPGVRYRYTRLRCGDWWVEDPVSPAYNTFRRIGCWRRPPFKVTTPDMSRDRTAYAYLAVIQFNMNPIVPGRGSGIFLHVQTGKPTNGCVSLPRAQLLSVLRWLSPSASPRIAISS
jgi:L,D-peptidoglycan transpeptidase YkuD (ErfK/YbiS/YcfS/YnhG family)